MGAILVGLNLLSVDIECGDILLLMVYDIRGRDLPRDKRLHRFIGGLGAPCQLSPDQFPTLKVWHSRECETTETGGFAALLTPLIQGHQFLYFACILYVNGHSTGALVSV